MNARWIGVLVWVALSGIIILIIHSDVIVPWENDIKRDPVISKTHWVGYYLNGKKNWQIDVEKVRTIFGSNRLSGTTASNGVIFAEDGKVLIENMTVKYFDTDIIDKTWQSKEVNANLGSEIKTVVGAEDSTKVSSGRMVYNPLDRKIVLTETVTFVKKNKKIISYGPVEINTQLQLLDIFSPYSLVTATMNISSQLLHINLSIMDYTFSNAVKVKLKDGRLIKSNRLYYNPNEKIVRFDGNVELVAKNMKWVQNKSRITSKKWNELLTKPTKILANEVSYTSYKNLILASGNIKIIQPGKQVTCKKLRFEGDSEKLILSEDVVWTESSGKSFSAKSLTINLKSEFLEAQGRVRSSFELKKRVPVR